MGALLNNRKVLGVFDYRNLISIDTVISTCSRYHIKISPAEIKKLCEQKLLVAAIKEGKEHFPQFVPERILFIRILQSQFNYPLTYLQQIVACEDRIISGVVDPDIRRCLLQLFRVEEGKAKASFCDDEIRSLMAFKYRGPIQHGYSPQVEFKNYDSRRGKGEINWEQTNRKIRELDHVEFFSTPDYCLGIDQGKISICIRKPRNVEATAMRMIGTLYTIYRGRLVKGRKRWGENSGRKDRINQRDENIRKLYKEYRAKNPRVAVEIHYGKLVDYAASVGLPVSRERIKRILYPYAKTPAGSAT